MLGCPQHCDCDTVTLQCSCDCSTVGLRLVFRGHSECSRRWSRCLSLLMTCAHVLTHFPQASQCKTLLSAGPAPRDLPRRTSDVRRRRSSSILIRHPPTIGMTGFVSAEQYCKLSPFMSSALSLPLPLCFSPSLPVRGKSLAVSKSYNYLPAICDCVPFD